MMIDAYGGPLRLSFSCYSSRIPRGLFTIEAHLSIYYSNLIKNVKRLHESCISPRVKIAFVIRQVATKTCTSSKRPLPKEPRSS